MVRSRSSPPPSAGFSWVFLGAALGFFSGVFLWGLSLHSLFKRAPESTGTFSRRVFRGEGAAKILESPEIGRANRHHSHNTQSPEPSEPTESRKEAEAAAKFPLLVPSRGAASGPQKS